MLHWFINCKILVNTHTYREQTVPSSSVSARREKGAIVARAEQHAHAVLAHLGFNLKVGRKRAASEDLLRLEALDQRRRRWQPVPVVRDAENRRVDVSDDRSHLVVVVEAELAAHRAATVVRGELLVPEVRVGLWREDFRGAPNTQVMTFGI